jgi:hypothetical protein
VSRLDVLSSLSVGRTCSIRVRVSLGFTVRMMLNYDVHIERVQRKTRSPYN